MRIAYVLALIVALSAFGGFVAAYATATVSNAVTNQQTILERI